MYRVDFDVEAPTLFVNLILIDELVTLGVVYDGSFIVEARTKSLSPFFKLAIDVNIDFPMRHGHQM